MNCPNCHRQLDEQTNFCKYCGTPVGSMPGTKKSDRKKAIRWIALGLICSVIAALGGYVISGHIRHQKVTPENLDYLVTTIDDTVEQVEDYFELYISKQGLELGSDDWSDFYLELEMAENQIIRESIYLRQIYEGYTDRKGWDPDKYEDYEALYEACRKLTDFVDSYDYDDPNSTCETYDLLMTDYQMLYDKVS